MIDLAINKNGNLIKSEDGEIATVGGGNWIRQQIYRALMEMPRDMIIGHQFKSTIEIEEILTRYLTTGTTITIPIPPGMINTSVTRNSDESLKIRINFPSTGQGGLSPVDYTYKERPGYHEQIDYAYSPNIEKLSMKSMIKNIEEIINIKTETSAVYISHRYSGNGTIRIFNIGSDFSETDEIITITTARGMYRYNLIDYASQDIETIDKANIAQGSEYARSPGILYEFGTPILTIKKDTPEGSILTVNIRGSRAVSFSNNVAVIHDIAESQIFETNPLRVRYLANLDIPMSPGRYMAKYSAILYHAGGYRL